MKAPDANPLPARRALDFESMRFASDGATLTSEHTEANSVDPFARCLEVEWDSMRGKVGRVGNAESSEQRAPNLARSRKFERGA